jgi:hypothetical protein
MTQYAPLVAFAASKSTGVPVVGDDSPDMSVAAEDVVGRVNAPKESMVFVRRSGGYEGRKRRRRLERGNEIWWCPLVGPKAQTLYLQKALVLRRIATRHDGQSAQ